MQPSNTTRVDYSSPADSTGSHSSGYTSSDYKYYRHASLPIGQLEHAPVPQSWPAFAPASLVALQNIFDIPRHNYPDLYLPDYPQTPYFPPTPHNPFHDTPGNPRLHPQPSQRLSYDAPQSPLYTEPVAMANASPRPAFVSHIAAGMMGDRLTLSALSTPNPPNAKPNYPYPTLVMAAILGSPRKALTLQGIYDALKERYQWFRDHWTEKAWKVRCCCCRTAHLAPTQLIIIAPMFHAELDPPQSVSE